MYPSMYDSGDVMRFLWYNYTDAVLPNGQAIDLQVFSLAAGATSAKEIGSAWTVVVPYSEPILASQMTTEDGDSALFLAGQQLYTVHLLTGKYKSTSLAFPVPSVPFKPLQAGWGSLTRCNSQWFGSYSYWAAEKDVRVAVLAVEANSGTMSTVVSNVSLSNSGAGRGQLACFSSGSQYYFALNALGRVATWVDGAGKACDSHITHGTVYNATGWVTGPWYALK